MTAKARVLRILRTALLPLSTPELTALSRLDRRDVWTSLVCLRRCGVVRRVNGRKPGGRRVTRWRACRDEAQV